MRYTETPCPHCKNYSNRGLTIDAVIEEQGKILLIKRGAEPFKDFWALPGGYVDWDETVEEAVAREVSEEIGVYSKPSRHPHQAIDLAYSVSITGEPKAGDDAVELLWAPLDDLPELAFDHTQIIDDYKTQKKRS